MLVSRSGGPVRLAHGTPPRCPPPPPPPRPFRHHGSLFLVQFSVHALVAPGMRLSIRRCRAAGIPSCLALFSLTPGVAWAARSKSSSASVHLAPRHSTPSLVLLRPFRRTSSIWSMRIVCMASLLPSTCLPSMFFTRTQISLHPSLAVLLCVPNVPLLASRPLVWPRDFDHGAVLCPQFFPSPSCIWASLRRRSTIACCRMLRRSCWVIFAFCALAPSFRRESPTSSGACALMPHMM
mmetsp:Transcript_48387/g.113681  ORF Transcript_48387/g.113681 Transcript_48387/m.113681 type:complete len:237 (-) Transcript_48387:912-1622(-)